MKKGWIVLVALFVLSLAAAAQVAAAQPKQLEVSGTVRVGSWEAGDALKPWNEAIAAYQKANPNVKIQLEAVPQEYGTKLLSEFASGTAPDIFMSGDGDVAKWVALGAATNLEPYITGSNGFDRNILLPAVAEFGKVNGSTYYLTKDYSPLVLYYNKDLFQKAGVDAPTAKWTWDDLLKTAQKLTIDANGKNATDPAFDANNIKQWGIQLPNSWGDTAWTRGILPIIYQNGGSLIAPDGSKISGLMNSEATLSALQWYTDLIKKHHVAPSKTDVSSFSGTDLFQSGIVSMLWTGVWPLNDYKKVSKLSFGTMSLPGGPKGNANVLCWSGFGLYSGSKNKDAAWDFLKYIATGEGAKQFANYAWTDVKSIIDAQGMAKDPYSAPIVADLANVKPIPDAASPNWPDCGDHFFVQEISTVLEGNTPLKEAMDKAASEGDACLKTKMSQAPAATAAK